MATDKIREQDLMENPDPRVPVCFCLDTSASMLETTGGEPTGKFVMMDGKHYAVVTGGTTRLETLQGSLKDFYDAIYKDENARFSAEICVVTFDDTAKMLSDFARVEYNDVREAIPQLTTGNATSLGAGINLALDALEERKSQYKSVGVNYYQPWLILMTDGEDNPASKDPSELIRARERIHELVNANRLCVYPFIIGNDRGIETLASLSPVQPPLRIMPEHFKGLFRWLGKSIDRVSVGPLTGAKAITLAEADVNDWNVPLE